MKILSKNINFYVDKEYYNRLNPYNSLVFMSIILDNAYFRKVNGYYFLSD